VASCFELGIDPGETGGATPICTSLSVAYEPLDIDPTRLGFCALPPVESPPSTYDIGTDDFACWWEPVLNMVCQ